MRTDFTGRRNCAREYTITVTARGFSTAVREGIEARVNDRLRVDMPMQIGAVSENVW